MWWTWSLLACRDPETTPSDDGGPDTTRDTAPASDTGSTDTETPEPTTVPDFTLTVDANLPLLLHATFDDGGASESWVEYRFETEAWLVAPAIAPGEAVVLGIPENTTVEARAVTVIDGVTSTTTTASATTGPLPSGFLRPQVNAWDVKLASDEPWVMMSVASGDFTFEGPYWIQIFDRQGRVVWYHRVPDELFSFYPSVAFSGTHIWYDAEDIFGFSPGDPHVTRRTLDGRWRVTHETPSAGQAYAEGPDGSFFYELRGSGNGIVQVDALGDATQVFDCEPHMNSIGYDGGDCLLNGCNWSEERNSLLASLFPVSTVLEVDLSTGEVLRQMGQIEQGEPYAFDPISSMFAYQHWPYWTPEGTLFVSTHLPCLGMGGCNENSGRDGIQVAAEYAVDDVSGSLTLVSSVVSTERWATQAGEAYRLPNGNVVQGYGQDGAMRELTPDGLTAFDVSWPKDNSGYRMVGHASLIADLYALNVGE